MVVFKKLVVIILVMGFSSVLLAQKPSWTDYYKRHNMYPESEFLVGFISGVNSNDEDAGEIKLVYEALAKNKLVQSIQVEIETNNSLDISNVNGKSGEEFLSKSISFSKANINGLTTKSYYDRKKKEVYAIATANKKELAFYYRNIITSAKANIEQKLSEGKRYVKKGNKEDALRSYYEAMPNLLNIDEARTLLIALNRKMYADISMDEINNLKLELINEINSLQNPNNLTLGETAYFMAYGLSLQLTEINEPVTLENFTFENTGLKSDFSAKWNNEFKAALVKAGDYNINELKEKSNNITIYGNYWKEGNLIKIVASASKYNNLIAVSKGSIPISWLQNENVDYLPNQINLVNLLKTYKLDLVSAPKTIKLGKALTTPIQIKLTNKNNQVGIKGIPIKFVNAETGDIIYTSTTNNQGISVGYLPAIQTQNAIITINAEINLSAYLNIPPNSLYYTITNNQNHIMPISIDMKTEKPTVFVQSNELINNNSVSIKTIEPVVKETLASKGYNFVDNKNDADFIIVIDANTTTGSEYQGIYFAFLDVNFSVVDAANNEEIYKTHLNQIKGGGGDYKKAGKKAYVLGAKKLKERIENVGF